MWPVTVGCRAARRADPKPGESAIVFGAGTVGIAVAIALKYFSCNHAAICDVSDFRLEKAKALGFEVRNGKQESLQEKAKAVFGEAASLSGMTSNVYIYVDAAGASDLIECYRQIGKFESRMVVVAVVAGLHPIAVLAMTYSQHALTGSGGYMPEDVCDVINIMESEAWDIPVIHRNTDHYLKVIKSLVPHWIVSVGHFLFLTVFSLCWSLSNFFLFW